MEERVYPLLVAFSVLSAIFVVFFPLFILRRDIEPIKSRGHFATFQILSGYIAGVLIFVSEVVNSKCVLLVICLYLGSLLTPPILLRGWVVYQKCALQIYSSQGRREEMLGYFNKWAFTLSLPFQFAVMLISALVVYVIGFLLYFYGTPLVEDEALREDYSLYVPQRCYTFETLIWIVVFIAMMFPPLFFIIFKLWKVREAFYLRVEILLIIVLAGPESLLFIISCFVPSFPPEINPSFWLELLALLFTMVSCVFPVVLSFKFEKIMGSQKNSLRHSRSAETIDLAKVFEDPQLLASFEKFSIETWSLENVLFYKSVQKYKAAEPEQRKQMAIAIAKNYVVIGSPEEVNLDSSSREKVLERIKAGEFSEDLFGPAESHIFKMMNHSTFPLWKKSAGFRSLLGEEESIKDSLAMLNR